MSAKHKKISTQFKLLAAAIFVLVLTVGTLSVIEINHLKTLYVEGLYKEAGMIGRSIRAIVYKNLEYFPLESLEGMSSYLRGMVGEHKEIGYCYIADEKNRILYHSQAREEGKAAPPYKGVFDPREAGRYKSVMTPSHYEIAVPIVKGNTVVGTVRTGIPKELVSAVVGGIIERNLWIFIFLVAVASALMYFLFSVSVTRPLSLLAGRLSSMGARFGLDVDLKGQRGYEPDEVARSLDALAMGLDEKMMSSEYVQNVIKGVVDSLFLLDQAGVIRMSNKKACDFMGYGKEEMIGKKFNDFLPASEISDLRLEERTIVDLALEDPSRSFDVTLLRKGGSAVPMLITASIIKDDRGVVEGVICTAKDISSLRKTENELKHLNEELRKNERAVLNILADLKRSHEELKTSQDQLVRQAKMASLGRLVSDMAHEVNNPLMIISGRSQLSMMEGTTPGEIQENLRIVVDQCERAKEIIERLLIFSRPGKGATSETDINTVVEFVVKLLEYQYSLANIKFVRHYAEGLPRITLDEKQMHEVFMNLIKNSAEAMTHGGTINVSTYLAEKDIAIEIADTGTGIPESIMAEIFDPFFTTKEHGTGLGLAVCYGIIKGHGGDIAFKSAVGKGTTATVTVPIGK